MRHHSASRQVCKSFNIFHLNPFHWNLSFSCAIVIVSKYLTVVHIAFPLRLIDLQIFLTFFHLHRLRSANFTLLNLTQWRLVPLCWRCPVLVLNARQTYQAIQDLLVLYLRVWNYSLIFPTFTAALRFRLDGHALTDSQWRFIIIITVNLIRRPLQVLSGAVQT